MLSYNIKEDQVIWLSLIVSLMIHGLLFTFSGKTFIEHAQFSVQPSAQMVEVSIENIKVPVNIVQQTPSAAEAGEGSIKIPEHVNKANAVIHSKSGVRVKANPDYFQNPSPEYPDFARQMRQEGLVLLSVDVNKEGDPVNVEIIQSSGFHLLDQAALKAVWHWKFQPGSIGGIRIGSTVTVPIRFRLER